MVKDTLCDLSTDTYRPCRVTNMHVAARVLTAYSSSAVLYVYNKNYL